MAGRFSRPRIRECEVNGASLLWPYTAFHAMGLSLVPLHSRSNCARPHAQRGQVCGHRGRGDDAAAFLEVWCSQNVRSTTGCCTASPGRLCNPSSPGWPRTLKMRSSLDYLAASVRARGTDVLRRILRSRRVHGPLLPPQFRQGLCSHLVPIEDGPPPATGLALLGSALLGVLRAQASYRPGSKSTGNAKRDGADCSAAHRSSFEPGG